MACQEFCICANSPETGLMPAILLKKQTLAQVFSCKFCEIFKNTLFYRTTLEAASNSPNAFSRITAPSSKSNKKTLLCDP